MQFLDYTGYNKKFNSTLYTFEFKGKMDNMEIQSQPLFIVPPIYDVSFKKVFASTKTGLTLLLDFLNSILFPKSKLIKELNFIEKEIPSNSHLKNDEGTLILDDVCIAKIQYLDEGKTKVKDVLIDVEMESNYQVDKYTGKFFNYATGIRNQNDFQETWVIALGVNRSKNPREISFNKSHMIKKYYANDLQKDLDYIRIFEIYLNDYYNKIDEKISIFEGEEIEDRGKEWIKLFTIELWCKKVNESCYCLPANILFKGDKIKKAIEKLSDIFGSVEHKIKVEKNFQKETEENFQKQLDEKYETGYKTGYENGYGTGYETGIGKGFDKGYLACVFKMIDKYFQKYVKGETLQSIMLPEKIKFSDLQQKYGESSEFKGFAKILQAQNLLID